MGHGAWIALAVIIGLIPLSMLSKRRRKRALPHFEDGIARHQSGDLQRRSRKLPQGRRDRSEICRRASTFAARPMRRLGDLKAGISDHTKAIRIEPKFADALMDRGILMYQSGNFDGAISDFSRVIKLNKKDANAYYHRGLSYLGKNDFRRAIADLHQGRRSRSGIRRGLSTACRRLYQARAMPNARKRITPRRAPIASRASGSPAGIIATPLEKFLRNLRPRLAAGIEQRLLARISRDRPVARAHALDTLARRLDATVRNIDQRALDRPHVLGARTASRSARAAFRSNDA